jgi:hypothetical protein
MGNLALWIAALVPSLVTKVLASVGFGVVVLTGLTAVTGQLEGYIYSSFGQFPGDIAGLLNLAGFGMAINIILGAITARVSLYVLLKSTRIIGA